MTTHNKTQMTEEVRARHAWLYEVAPDSKVAARDVAQIFEISIGALNHRCRAGTLPPADSHRKAHYPGGKGRRYWYVSTVIKAIEEALV